MARPSRPTRCSSEGRAGRVRHHRRLPRHAPDRPAEPAESVRPACPAPCADDAEENWFTVRERIGAAGEILVPLDEREIQRAIEQIAGAGPAPRRGLPAVQLRQPRTRAALGERCRAAGLTVSLSSDVLPEFREYERASTTVINASLRPTVGNYLLPGSGLANSPHRAQTAAGAGIFLWHHALRRRNA